MTSRPPNGPGTGAARATGAEVLGKIGREASAVAQRFKGLATGQPRQVSINLTLPDGVRVIGTVPDVQRHDRAVDLLEGESTRRRPTVDRGPRAGCRATGPAVVRLHVSHNADMRPRAPAAPEALRILAELVDIYRAGMSSPLPLPADSSRSYTKCRNDGSDVRSAVYKTGYRSWQRNANDRMQPEIVALWGPDAPISVLLEQRPAVEGELVRRGHPVRDARPPDLDSDSGSQGGIVSAPAAFHLLGPLPTGTTLLEASAGTGKTYTIAALATRYIAQGTATIDQMLMITFGRSATRELRERVREALTNARDALRDNAGVDDPVIAMLAALPP